MAVVYSPDLELISFIIITAYNPDMSNKLLLVSMTQIYLTITNALNDQHWI